MYVNNMIYVLLIFLLLFIFNNLLIRESFDKENNRNFDKYRKFSNKLKANMDHVIIHHILLMKYHKSWELYKEEGVDNFNEEINKFIKG